MKKKQREQALKSQPKNAYLDASFCISAASDIDKHGEKARAVLEKIKNKEYTPHTASLTIDEVLWVIQREKGKEFALETANTILSISSLRIISVDREIIKKSLEIYTKEKLNPRDAIHVAAMKSESINIIISSDTNFDNIEGIQRVDFTK